MGGDPDEALVRRIATGDPAAMRALMASHLPRITALAVRMLGSVAEADDVAQETFLKIWKSAASWRSGSARFSTWVHRVALNLCYDQLRRRQDVSMADPPEQADGGPAPDAGLMDEESAGHRVDRAMQALAPRQREAIVLVYYQNLSNIEAAEIMEISVDALESLLARGRRALQAILTKDKTDG